MEWVHKLKSPNQYGALRNDKYPLFFLSLFLYLPIVYWYQESGSMSKIETLHFFTPINQTSVGFMLFSFKNRASLVLYCEWIK